MSRKHYIKIADVISKLPNRCTKVQVVQCITNALRGTNPYYDSARFYQAAMGDKQ